MHGHHVVLTAEFLSLGLWALIFYFGSKANRAGMYILGGWMSVLMIILLIVTMSGYFGPVKELP